MTESMYIKDEPDLRRSIADLSKRLSELWFVGQYRAPWEAFYLVCKRGAVRIINNSEEATGYGIAMTQRIGPNWTKEQAAKAIGEALFIAPFLTEKSREIQTTWRKV